MICGLLGRDFRAPLRAWIGIVCGAVALVLSSCILCLVCGGCLHLYWVLRKKLAHLGSSLGAAGRVSEGVS